MDVEIERSRHKRDAPGRGRGAADAGSRLNAVCPYYTMFPLDFPLRVLASAKPEETVLDPFSGRGTTLFAARTLGLPAWGIDSAPVAAHLSAAKLASATPDEIIDLAAWALDTPASGERVPPGEFWERAYAASTLEALCRLRAHLLAPQGWLAGIATDAVTLLRALMLGVLHGPRTKGFPGYLSNQMPRTFATKPAAAVRFWKARGMAPPDVPVLGVLMHRARHVLAETVRCSAGGEVVLGDARQVLSVLRPDRPVQWIITSPPYVGMRTYVPDQWLRHWFVGGAEKVDYGSRGQLGAHGVENAFIEALAEVWERAARLCADTARMVIRFGALPSRFHDPAAVIKRSLRQSGAWRVQTVVPAGTPPAGRRQADQFGAAAGYAREVDVWAKRAG